MNPLPNEWAIKHRADSCSVTQRPFVSGEYFYTLLYHGADGYRREDLSEEAWQRRNENIRPFSFWKSRYEPLSPKPTEPMPKESAEQLFRRLMASDSPPANACYVLAAMLERKRVLKQVKTEETQEGRVLIYEQDSTGDVFNVPENAARKLASLLEEKGQPEGALRLKVIGGGCSGLQYVMDLVDGPMERDILVPTQNVRLVVDPKSALFVSGSVLDYSEDLQKGGFKVTNPNAVAHCSCGESFAV